MKRDNNSKPILLTVKEVCVLLRVHRPKVYELIKAGTIEGLKIGSDWRVKIESIEKLIGDIPEDFFKGSGALGGKEETFAA